MSKHSTRSSERVWYESAHASLCVLGAPLRREGFFAPLEERGHIKQKVLKYTAVQKLEMLFVALLAGAKAVSQTATTVRVDPALSAAFGLPGCAEPAVSAATLDAATLEDVAALQEAGAPLLQRYGQTPVPAEGQGLLVVAIALSPWPTSAPAEGSTRGDMGRHRSKTGRKVVRVRAAHSQETLWETVIPGRTVESLPLLQEAIAQMERLLDLEGEDEAAQAKRARGELRLDSGWGRDTSLPWLLARGSHVTGKVRSSARVRALVKGITNWDATSSRGRAVAVVPHPVAFARPLRQYAVRTPSVRAKSGDDDAVLFTTRTDLTMTAVVDHYDGRSGDGGPAPPTGP